MSATVETMIPTPNQSVGDVVDGFVIERVESLAALRSVAYVARHTASGARLLKLHNADSENLFAIGLRTPPSDDTGIAHILEHTVLCGSQKFPVKDPFVELLKTSLASFLNAMTYPDRTVYPCASQNRRDFFNLMDVYCDAVYRPLLREFHFQQEGHRLGFSDTGNPDSELVIKGIVYNEMKGAYSDFHGTAFRKAKAALYPDNAYGFDSGGDPKAIPDLTYADFCDFHRTLYHPSNSFIFAYGDVSFADLTARLTDHLAGFETQAVDTSIAEQPAWDVPRTEATHFPIGAGEDPADHYAASLTWMCGSAANTDDWLMAKLIAGYLLDHDAAPLRRALIASGLGKGLMGSGYVDSIRDTAFTVGLRGIEPDAAPAFEAVVLDCLREQSAGMDHEQLRAALHQMEIDLGDVPSMYPLHVMSAAYRRWVYDCDPIEALDLQPALARLAEIIEQADGPEAELRRLILENPHRVLLTFIPDAELQSREAEAERAMLAERKAGMDADTLRAIAEQDAEVEAAQRTGNTPEALATLPRLQRSDVPAQGLEPVIERADYGSACHLSTQVLHGEVSHWECALDLAGLDDDLVEWLPLYTTALTRLGAGGLSWDELSKRQEAVVGGISAAASCVSRVDDPNSTAFYLTLSSCALHRNVGEMARYMALRASALDLDDHARLRELIAERAVHLRNGVVSGGSGYATRYASRGLRSAQTMGERLGGFTQIRRFESFAKNIDSRFDEALAALERIRSYMRDQAPAVLSTVGVVDGQATAALLNHFSRRAAPTSVERRQLTMGDRRAGGGHGARVCEGIAVAADAAFVAQVADIGRVDLPAAAALQLLASQLRVGFLWEQIRVLGGAYGARTGWDRHTGIFSVSSYRDPHIKRSLETYAVIADHIVEDMDLSPDTLEQAIIGSMKSFDRPLRPDDAVGQTLWRHLRGSTAADRQAYRDAMLAVTADHIRDVARTLLGPALQQATTCIVSSRDRLTIAANEGVLLEIADL